MFSPHQQPSSQQQQQQQQQQSQSSQILAQQQPSRRISVSGSPSASVQLGSMALSAQSIDEDSPMNTFQHASNIRNPSFDTDSVFLLNGNNNSASATSLSSSLSNSLILNGSSNPVGTGGANTNSSISAGIVGSNSNSNSSNTSTNGSNNPATNMSYMQSPFNIQGPIQQQPFNDQRRFTWTGSNLSIDPSAGTSVTNPAAATPTSNTSLNGGLFTFSPILSSIQKYREQLPVIPPQQQIQPHQTPIQTSETLNYPNNLQNQQLLGSVPSPSISQNIAALFKRLDDTVFELKTEFKLLEQENEQLRINLNQTHTGSMDAFADNNTDFSTSNLVSNATNPGTTNAASSSTGTYIFIFLFTNCWVFFANFFLLF